MKNPAAPQSRYDSIAVTLHWLIAALIMTNLATGFFRYGIGGSRRHLTIDPALHTWIVSFHMTMGAAILVLSVLRLGWRLAHPAPPFSASVSPVERLAARTVYVAFYFLMIAMPIVGTGIMSTYAHQYGALLDGTGGSIPMLWHVPWPTIPVIRSLPLPDRRVLHDILDRAHSIGGYVFLMLMLIHVAGALKHQIFDRHPEIQRMWFGRREPVPGDARNRWATSRADAQRR